MFVAKTLMVIICKDYRTLKQFAFSELLLPNMNHMPLVIFLRLYYLECAVRLFLGMDIKPRTFLMVGKYSTTELCSQPS